MEVSTLTFVSLDERIEAPPKHPSYTIMPDRRAKVGHAAVAVAGTLALILGKLHIANIWSGLAILALVAIEIGGLVLVVASQLPSLKLTFSNQRREYAETLDFDMPHHQGLVAWLHSFPREQLKAMHDFASHRIDRFRSKLPLLTGGIDKLGALPVLAALVIQFKDMHWPPHPSWMQIILFGGLMFFYWLCMLVVSQRLRLELYELLLKKALEADDGGNGETKMQGQFEHPAG
jgi:hypothetical protein